MATLLGGEDVAVQTIDGAAHIVRVRQLPISALGKYAGALNDPAAMIALLCDKPAEWADSLTQQSALEVLRVGDKLNTGFFAAIGQANLDRAEAMMPGTRAALLRTMGLPSGSPTAR
jgi:hypothetical protein